MKTNKILRLPLVSGIKIAPQRTLAINLAPKEGLMQGIKLIYLSIQWSNKKIPTK
jgi:hypothetical protein